MSRPAPVPPPAEALDLDAVLERVPELRQSLLAKFDDCPLSAYFEMKYGTGWHTHPQAAGVIFHRVAAECLRVMREQDSEVIPQGVALAILEEALEQREIPPEERVRVPLRDVPLLRMTVRKFAKDNEFSVRQIVDIERRLSSVLVYADDEGQVRERRVSGQLDVLIADPKDDEGAIVVDWKNTWARPPRRDDPETDEEKPALSYHGFFQLSFYAWLVMKNYPAVKRVTLREFYPRRTEARKATISRSQLERIEKDLGDLALDFDRTYGSGKPERLRLPEVAPWNPQPGAHCYFCVARRLCPIPREARRGITVQTEREARQAVSELQVTEAIRKGHRGALRPFVEENGPVPARHSKGRLVFGLKDDKHGKPTLRFFVPEGSDRGPQRQPEDRKLEDALRRASESAKGANGNGGSPRRRRASAPGDAAR